MDACKEVNKDLNDLLSIRNCQCCNYDKVVIEKNDNGLYTIKCGYKEKDGMVIGITYHNAALLNLHFEPYAYENSIGQKVQCGDLERIQD